MKEKDKKKWLYMTIVNLAVLIMPMVLDVCRSKYYQPKEPDGFEDYVKTIRTT